MILRLALLALFLFASPAHANVAQGVEQWLRLRNPAICYPFAQYRNFLNQYPDWPSANVLRTQAEQALSDSPPDAGTIQAWFKRFPPLSDNGRFLYFRTLVQSGNGQAARQFLLTEWQNGAFNSNQQDWIRQHYGSWLNAEHHAKRLSKLLWDGNLSRAEKALTYVGSDTKRIGQIRLALQRSDSRAAAQLATLSGQALYDPGLVFDRVRYNRQRNQDDLAIRALAMRRTPVEPYATLWWRERALLARRALEKKQYKQAYDLAAQHGALTGAEYADAEWLAGWLALTRLNMPGKALQHFADMHRNVKTPISVARAAYWAGIAASKTAGRQQDAAQWYRTAAQHMHTFYGQMAAYALGDVGTYYAAFFARAKPNPGGQPKRGDLVQAATILHNKGMEKDRDLFLSAVLNHNKDSAHTVIAVAERLKSNKMKLAAAKAAYDQGVFLRDALFPRISVPRNSNVETALTLAIIRQESMFDPYAKSHANAMGLMQLLPGTATQTARQYGVAHRNASQLFNPQHNMVLGQHYLGRMLNRYQGDIALAAAAYNAGPGNVDKWVGQFGLPGKDGYTWVDWAERIPFYETRNYVQRIWEAYQIYSYILKH